MIRPNYIKRICYTYKKPTSINYNNKIIEGLTHEKIKIIRRIDAGVILLSFINCVTLLIISIK